MFNPTKVALLLRELGICLTQYNYPAHSEFPLLELEAFEGSKYTVELPAYCKFEQSIIRYPAIDSIEALIPHIPEEKLQKILQEIFHDFNLSAHEFMYLHSDT